MAHKDTVDIRSLGYVGMASKWDLIHDLLGGTERMRAARGTWLPQEPKEENQSYDLRISRSFLYGAFANTLNELVSKPFSRSVSVDTKGLDDRLSTMVDDVDGSGTNLTGFAKKQFESALKYGLTHVLVDFPNVDPDLNLADERKSGIRPKWILIEPPSLIGWRFVSDISDELESIRVAETRVEPVGDFGEELVEFIRVYTRTGWELWKKVDKEFVIDDFGVHSFGAVPLVTMYIDRTGLLTGSPPLMDLAWLNLAHWQSSSDQRSILRMIRSGILFAKGLTEEEIARIVIGPNTLISTTSDDADMKYVEHSGKAIEAGENDIQKLEERMEILGLQPMIERTSKSTATGKILDEARTHSNIQSWIRVLEKAILEQIRLSAQWIKQKIPDDFAVDIFNDFGISVRGAQDINALILMRDKRQISHETLLKEAKRRRILSEELDVEPEIEKIRTEDIDDLDNE